MMNQIRHWRTKIATTTSRKHERIPGLRKLPLPVLAIISLLVFINILTWAAVGVVLHYNVTLVSTSVLAYTLGLRHALDADHIAAIDLMTRRLIASGQRPVTVGTFFSLGHSTIVIVTSIVVAATAAAIKDEFGSFGKVGGIIGTSVSASFLIILGLLNMYIMYKLIRRLRKLIRTAPGEEKKFEFQGAGCIFNLLKKMFKLIDRPWKMYPLGVLFGLGFDTSSEVALLGIASIQGAKGTSIWLILIFPLLFTVGMCMVDTIDGSLMMTLYTSTALAKDQIAILYYSIVLTMITVVVAMVIGIIQVLSLILNVAEPTGKFWDGVEIAGDYYEVIGGSICGSFIVFGGLSYLVYKPWRRWIDRYRPVSQLPQTVTEETGDDSNKTTMDASAPIVVKDARLFQTDESRNPDTVQESGTVQNPDTLRKDTLDSTARADMV